MFKIGEFLNLVQDPLPKSHWLSLKVSKHGGQIQIMLLTCT